MMASRTARVLGVVALLTLAARGWGATTISDTLYYPDGRKASGRIVITWGEFTAAGPRTIVAGQVVVAVKDGAFTIALEPNDTATPAGTSYAARYFLSDGTTRLENWVVATSGTAVTVAAVRVSTVPTPAVVVKLTQLDRGGAATGDLMKWNGTVWAPAAASGSGITSLGAQTGATQTFANDTNVTIASAANVHTLGWTGALAKSRQHAQTAYKDEGNTFTAAQAISGATTDLLTFTNSGGSDWITLTGNKSRFKVWNSGTAGLAEFQALTFFGSGAGLSNTTIPTAALVASGDYPASGEKAAMAGTSGTPGAGNKYVTDADARNTNARTPTSHASSHQNSGTDEVGTATATANAIPKAGSGGRLAKGWAPLQIDTADQGYFVGVSVFAMENGTTNTAAFTANQAKVWQFLLPFPVTIGKITFEVQTASGTCGGTCSAQLALWNADLATVAVATGVMASGGTPNLNSAAVYTVSVTPITLNSGVYNLVMTTDSTALLLRGLSPPSQQINQLNNQTVKKWGTCANAGSAGALPSSCGTVTATTAIPPMVTFER